MRRWVYIFFHSAVFVVLGRRNTGEIWETFNWFGGFVLIYGRFDILCDFWDRRSDLFILVEVKSQMWLFWFGLFERLRSDARESVVANRTVVFISRSKALDNVGGVERRVNTGALVNGLDALQEVELSLQFSEVGRRGDSKVCLFLTDNNRNIFNGNDLFFAINIRSIFAFLFHRAPLILPPRQSILNRVLNASGIDKQIFIKGHNFLQSPNWLSIKFFYFNFILIVLLNINIWWFWFPASRWNLFFAITKSWCIFMTLYHVFCWWCDL